MAVAVPVTMIISSVISVLITSLIFCLVIKKRNTSLKSQKRFEVPSSKDTPLVIYDLPNICDDTTNVNKNIELQTNSAYGQLWELYVWVYFMYVLDIILCVCNIYYCVVIVTSLESLLITEKRIQQHETLIEQQHETLIEQKLHVT